MTDTLSLAALNRATLARQLLLGRSDLTPKEAIAQLAGMQAQVAKPPFIGLWSRLEGFEREALIGLVERREVVRVTAMRGTLHYVTAADYLRWRLTWQPMLTLAMAGVLRDRAKDLDVPALVRSARAFLLERPRTFTALRAHLVAQFPDGDERAMGFAVRNCLPLVMVPNGSTWGYAADAEFAVADAWLGAPIEGSERPAELIRRYLGAFGPATIADVEKWSGMKGLKPTFTAIRGTLAVFQDERQRELFDLPDAPRPPEDTPAPVRFLPDFDNLVLAHADRTRLVSDLHRPRLVTKNLKVLATILVDGRVAGTWRIDRQAKAATLVIEPFEALSPAVTEALAEEGQALLRFSEPDAQGFDFQVEAPQA